MEPLDVLFATNRPAVRALFLSLRLQAPHAVTVAQVTPRVETLGGNSMPLGGADIAVIDIAIGHPEASELCRVLRTHRPDLPLLGLVCCPYAITPWQIRVLAAAGVGSWLDLQATTDELLTALQHAASTARRK